MIECPYGARWCRELLREEEGPTAVEYAIMLALIIAVCIGSVTLMAERTRSSFDDSADAIERAFSP